MNNYNLLAYRQFWGDACDHPRIISSLSCQCHITFMHCSHLWITCMYRKKCVLTCIYSKAFRVKHYNKPNIKRVQTLADISRSRCVTIATQPVHRLRKRRIAHNWGGIPHHSPSYIRARAIVWACGRRQAGTQTHKRGRSLYISRRPRPTQNVSSRYGVPGY